MQNNQEKGRGSEALWLFKSPLLSQMGHAFWPTTKKLSMLSLSHLKSFLLLPLKKKKEYDSFSNQKMFVLF